MEKYILILGRDVELSLLELISFLRKEDINYKILDKYQNLIVISLEKLFDINKLGGLVKIAKIVDKNFLDNLFFDKNKIIYTVNDEEIKDYLKEKFKQEKIKAFYKSEIKSLTTSSKLDLELIKFKDYLAHVTSISKPKEYKKRDELRPFFEARKVISIRLAKILINLSQAKHEILDPFCGQGTILQEALLLGLNCYGIDFNIKECMENLKWLKSKFNIKANYKLFQEDSRNLSRLIRKVECCVTEPYFGPYFKKYPKYEGGVKVIKELENLYLKVFLELDKVVEKKIVITLPIIKTNIKKNLKLNINKLISGTRFKIASFDEVTLPINYTHKGAIIEREIYILEK